MLHFDWPWLFALLPLPWLLRRFLHPLRPAQGAALRVPELRDFEVLVSGGEGAQGTRLNLLLACLAWLLLVTAAARPEWLGEPVEVPVNGRDLMLAIDLSRSMEENDFTLNDEPVNRLVACKAVAGEFIARRVGDRVGLILFGDQAYLQAPLTFDRGTVAQLLNEAEITMAGQRTAIGDALGLAVKRLREQKTKHKVLILMTDGQNTAGVIDPLRAADLAAEAGLTVHTIGIGADPTPQRGMFGFIHVNPNSDLDEKTLKEIAKRTGGRYFRARDASSFEQIYQEIDKLEPVDHSGQHFRPTTALFHWPLGAGLAVFGLLLALSPLGPRGAPA